jgi:hypothetical protein
MGDGVGDNGCVDIDECLKDNGGCTMSPLAKCTNNFGVAPSCACPAGYTGSGVGSAGCSKSAVSTASANSSGKFRWDDATVTDNSTHLVWQRLVPTTYTPVCSGKYDSGSPADDACTWEEAKKYCGTLSLADAGWRLPSRDELLSIVDNSRTMPAIDVEAFPNTASDWFWSSTAYVSAPGDAFLVYFSNGFSTNNVSSSTYRVRCVR